MSAALTSATEANQDLVSLTKAGRVGIVVLDRPRALNALNVDMVASLSHIMEELAADCDIDAIVIRSSSRRAFCAGGDMRFLGTLPSSAERIACGTSFFTTEYRLNLFMHHCVKPIISLIDGIAMGGGIGLSVYGSHRVVSERAQLAMPEVALGFFPDVGGAWFLNRCPGAIGRYLALTGVSIGPADALFCGLATHHVPAEHFDALVEALSNANALSHEAIDGILQQLAADIGPSELSARAPLLDDIFGAATLEAALQRLNAAANTVAPWLAAASHAIAKASPTSLKATWRRLTGAKSTDLLQILIQDLRMAVRMVAAAEFVEGVRAVLVDKDQNPHWQPAILDEISDQYIDDMLAELENESNLEIHAHPYL